MDYSAFLWTIVIIIATINYEKLLGIKIGLQKIIYLKNLINF